MENSCCSNLECETDRKTDRQTDRQTDIQTTYYWHIFFPINLLIAKPQINILFEQDKFQTCFNILPQDCSSQQKKYPASIDPASIDKKPYAISKIKCFRWYGMCSNWRTSLNCRIKKVLLKPSQDWTNGCMYWTTIYPFYPFLCVYLSGLNINICMKLAKMKF